MAPSSKNAAAAKDRRKSSTVAAVTVTSAASAKPSNIVTLKVTPQKLRAMLDPDYIKEDTPVKQSPAAVPNSGAENASDSTPNSPPPAGTPAAQSATVGPPTEGPKKKGVKRSAGAAANGNGEPKVRGKPGPKKKQRLEDGTIEGSGRGALAAHKLGPKANQGAINAGLRALDRSGKPCRRWQKGGFTLKSFTGVVWEIPRWTAPPRSRPESASADDGSENATPASEGGGSNKENSNSNIKGDNNSSQVVKSEASNNGGDVEMQGATPSFAADNSPAPVALAAA